MNDNVFLHLQQQASSAPGRVAFVAPAYPDLDYGTLQGCIATVVKQLGQLGIHYGEPVAFIADREPVTAVLALALMSHASAVPLNPDVRAHELASVLSSVPVRAILVPASQRNACQHLLDSLDLTIIEYHARAWTIELVPVDGIDNNNRPGPAPAVPVNTALILQTSGSTATPRIVPLSHGNLIAAAGNVIATLALTADDACLHMLPMFHVGGLVDVLLAPLLSGGRVIFNRGFDSNNFFVNIAEYSPSWTQTVPTMLRQLVDVAEQQDMDRGPYNLRLIRSVSSPLPKDLYEAAQRIFSTSIVEIYGMTETAGVITSNPLDPELQKPGSVGVSAGPEIRIMSTGGVARPMKTGEVQVKGNSIMPAYLSNNPGEIPAQEFEDGWLMTGDLGYLDDDGYLFLTGRLKDVINRGGEKISPAEIDTLALGFPGVIDAASFPITDAALGEDIALAVVMKSSTPQSDDSLGSYLKASLAYFKLPRQIIQVDAIPRHNGKLRRQELAAQFFAEVVEPGKGGSADNTPGDDSSDELAAMWAEILEQEAIGRDDDFFFMGGNSLLATILVNRIQEQWGIPVMVSALYEAPVLHEFEEYLQQHYPEQVGNIDSREPRD